MLPEFLVAETTVREAGTGPAMALGGLRKRANDLGRGNGRRGLSMLCGPFTGQDSGAVFLLLHSRSLW